MESQMDKMGKWCWLEQLHNITLKKKTKQNYARSYIKYVRKSDLSYRVLY